MTDRETTRLIAWSKELRRVHHQLRKALYITRAAVKNDGPTEDASRDLLFYCHGFCTALDKHHEGEDRTLFPAIEAAHPQLGPVLRALEQDHSMIAHLLNELRDSLEQFASAAEIEMHLDGVEAVMETHFDYEERQLLTVLESLELRESVSEVLGPL